MALEISLTHLSGSRKDTVETFRTLPLKLGRSDECQVAFHPDWDMKVSGVHAEIRQQGGGLVIHDLKSRNGVLVNGVKVNGHAPLPASSIVQLGSRGPKMRLRYGEAEGISFARLKASSGQQNTIGRPSDRLAPTETGIPAFSEEALEESASTHMDPHLVMGLLICAVFLAVSAFVLYAITR